MLLPLLLGQGGGAPAAQTLTPALYTNTNEFFAPAVTSTRSLTPARYDNTQAFYAAVITQTGAAQPVNPSLYANTQTFYAHAVTATRALLPTLVSNTQAFYAPTVASLSTLAPARYDNAQAFYSAKVSQAIYPSIAQSTQEFYAPVVTQGGGAQSLLPPLYENPSQFFAFTNTLYITFPDWVTDGWVEPGWVGWPYFNQNQFFSPTITAGDAPSLIDYGDGVAPRKRKPREFNKAEATALRDVIAQIVDPVKEEAPAEVKIVKTQRAVSVVTSTQALTAPVPPKVDADAIAAEVSAILARAGIAAKQAESVKVAREAFAAAQENMRLRIKRRREEELLLLL